MKIALVHDYLTQEGGAEQVLKAFSELYPNAPIYTWFYDKERVPYFANKDVRTSFLQKLPIGGQNYQWYLPLLPAATESFDLSEFDVVLSSSSSFIKGIITRPETLHICYCHTPPRYLWTDTHEYVENLKRPWFVRKLLPLYMNKLRTYDALSANRVDVFISNSQNVRRRIRKYYKRESLVVYPPVDTHLAPLAETLGNYYITGGRLMSYKRFDVVIKAFNRLKLPLNLRSGPEMESLQKLAKPNISFLGRISDTTKHELLSKAIAFIHQQEEDLGITPIEAMASGRPVIAYGAGGVFETVENGKTGTFFHEQTWESLYQAVINFDHTAFSPEYIHKHSQKFSLEHFKKNISETIEKQWRAHQEKYTTVEKSQTALL